MGHSAPSTLGDGGCSSAQRELLDPSPDTHYQDNAADLGGTHPVSPCLTPQTPLFPGLSPPGNGVWGGWGCVEPVMLHSGCHCSINEDSVQPSTCVPALGGHWEGTGGHQGLSLGLPPPHRGSGAVTHTPPLKSSFKTTVVQVAPLACAEVGWPCLDFCPPRPPWCPLSHPEDSPLTPSHGDGDVQSHHGGGSVSFTGTQRCYMGTRRAPAMLPVAMGNPRS